LRVGDEYADGFAGAQAGFFFGGARLLVFGQRWAPVPGAEPRE
jgi:hypothetical protein